MIMLVFDPTVIVMGMNEEMEGAHLLPLRAPWQTFTVTVSVEVFSPFAFVQYREKICGADPVRVFIPTDPPPGCDEAKRLPPLLGRYPLLVKVQLTTPHALRTGVPHVILDELALRTERLLYSLSTRRFGLGAPAVAVTAGAVATGAVVEGTAAVVAIVVIVAAGVVVCVAGVLLVKEVMRGTKSLAGVLGDD